MRNKKKIRKNNSVNASKNRENFLYKLNETISQGTVSYEYSNVLLKHKVFIKNLLNLIKNTQLELLSENLNHKKNNKFYFLIIINILKNLEGELNSTFNENLRKKTCTKIIDNKNKNNKNFVKNRIYIFLQKTQ